MSFDLRGITMAHKRSSLSFYRRSLLQGLAACAVLGVVLPSHVLAADDDELTFRIEFKDGTVSPQRLEVPANKRIKLELYNTGTTPAEFESLELRKEKVLAPGTNSSLVIRTLDPGQYDFFDDFRPGQPAAVLVAK